MILHEKYNKILELVLNNNPKAKKLFMDFYKKCPKEVKENLRKEKIHIVHDFDDDNGFSYGIAFPYEPQTNSFTITLSSLMDDPEKADSLDVDFSLITNADEEIDEVPEDELDSDYNYGDLASFYFYKYNNPCEHERIIINFQVVHKQDGYYLLSEYSTTKGHEYERENSSTKIELADVVLADENNPKL